MKLKMEVKEYLKSLGVKIPSHKATVIIIDGPQGPTGKTTLKTVLTNLGYTVFEKWETVTITLDKPLEHVYPNMLDSVITST
jgi:polynucleotide 5'-kinase involved in rRNA processing